MIRPLLLTPLILASLTPLGEGEAKKKVPSEEVINARKALWLRSKSEIKEDEYLEFYKHLTHDQEATISILHEYIYGRV